MSEEDSSTTEQTSTILSVNGTEIEKTWFEKKENFVTVMAIVVGVLVVVGICLGNYITSNIAIYNYIAQLQLNVGSNIC